MDIVFMGSPDFAVPSLKKIIENKEINLKAVVTQPDRKKGRGQKVKPTPVKKTAVKAGIIVYEQKNVNKKKSVNKLEQLKPDLIVVVAFGQILSREIIDLPKKGCINLHASLLPKYRGASPIHQPIINGESETGVTVMFIEEELDAGDIISQKRVKIDEKETVGDLHDKLARIGSNLLVKSMIDIKNNRINPEPQDDSKASYTGKLNKNIGKIDWNKSAKEIYNLVRGVNPWPGAYTYLEDKLLKIWQVSIINNNVQNNKPGTIVEVSEKDGIQVQAGSGIIKIEKLQLEGRKKLMVSDFLRGYELNAGQILG